MKAFCTVMQGSTLPEEGMVAFTCAYNRVVVKLLGRCFDSTDNCESEGSI